MDREVMPRFLRKIGGRLHYHGGLPDPEDHRRVAYGEFEIKSPREIGRIAHYSAGPLFNKSWGRIMGEIEAFGEDVFVLCEGKNYVVYSGVPVLNKKQEGAETNSSANSASSETGGLEWVSGLFPKSRTRGRGQASRTRP